MEFEEWEEKHCSQCPRAVECHEKCEPQCSKGQNIWCKEDKIETAWVIQRNDGKFFTTYFDTYFMLADLRSASIMKDRVIAEEVIKSRNLQNCKPVRVEIKVVE